MGGYFILFYSLSLLLPIKLFILFDIVNDEKVGIISLGCAKNLVDSENILGLLDHDKYQITSDIEEADIVFINTCGFIEASKKNRLRLFLTLFPAIRK